MRSLIKVGSLLLAFSSLAIAQGVCSSFQSLPGRCDLSATPLQQARCLLRPVKKFANLGEPLTSLPAPLDNLIGQPTSPTLTIDQLQAFLASKGVSEADVGGALSIALTKPKYFVIHDTSDFLAGRTEFPENINEDTFSPNKVQQRAANQKICHVYVNRLGKSATAVVFESSAPPPGTKFGSCHSSQRSAFIHIENVQPRIRDHSVSFDNDGIAPSPGFTDRQLERLALLYIVASVRSGKWLIPAYHSPIDLGYKNQHDDPQNFDLNRWAQQLSSLISVIGGGSSGGNGNAGVDGFDLPEPAQLTNPKMLWATHYFVFTADSSSGGQPLLDMSGGSLGATLSTKNWCLGAIEGTIRVRQPNGAGKVFNFAGRGSSLQVDCSGVIHNPSINLQAIGKSRYQQARGPFGDGAQNMILVPFRSIAVDKSRIPIGSVVFIPAARGRNITLPNGQTVQHDGYFFAADTGGAIQQDHIDIFGGISDANPFPNFVHSTPTPTFEAFLVNDPQIVATLKSLHSPGG
ncbi:MAG TPA: 3D domain-containing protein [Pyrinomonadaceae bacterium]|nr:3D domain-containing protein [Pyrinomonadaceae bacterium]